MNISAHNDMLTVSVIAPAQWPEICLQFDDLSFEQTLTYSQAAAKRVGAANQYLAFHNSDGVLAGAICLRLKTLPLLDKGIAWAPAGPMVQPNGTNNQDMLQPVLRALRSFVAQRGHILRLRLPVTTRNPENDCSQLVLNAGFRPTDKAQSYRTVLVDCTPDEDLLLRNLHGKWRNPLRNALKSGLEVEVAPLATAHERFDKMYREVQSAKGFQPDIPPEFYYELTGSDFAHDVLFARIDGEDVAGMTIGMSGRNAVYLFGATTAQGRSLNAGHFLMWHAILECKKRGINWLDLGGIDPDSNPSVTRFKQRTKGIDVTASGPFEYRPKRLSSVLILLAEYSYNKLKGKK